MYRLNPDVDVRRLERNYQNSGSINDATHLMTAYFRIGEIARAAELLQIIEDQYAQINVKDLGLEATIIASHLNLGRKSADLCEGGYGTVVCRYDKTIIWDVKRGYPIGTTQGWIDAINLRLFTMAWVGSTPTPFKDILHPRREDSFESQRKPMYAIALFHEMTPEDYGWIRVMWNNINLPRIMEDHIQYKWWETRGSSITIMLEDEPIGDYHGPKICTGYVAQARSEGRSSSGDSFTMRVPLQIGIEKALSTMEQLAYRIYFAKDWRDASDASGTGLYWPV